MQPTFYSWLVRPTTEMEIKAIDKAVDDNTNDKIEVIDLADQFSKKINTTHTNKEDQPDKEDQPETC